MHIFNTSAHTWVLKGHTENYRGWFHNIFTTNLAELKCCKIIKTLNKVCSGREKCCEFIKNIISSSNFHMHIFNMSVTYMQSIKRLHWMLSEELISQSVHK